MQHIIMDHPHTVIVAAAALCIHQLLTTQMVIFDDVPTASEARATKRHRHELTSYKRILSSCHILLSSQLITMSIHYVYSLYVHNKINIKINQKWGIIGTANLEYACLTDLSHRQCTARMLYGKFHSNHGYCVCSL